MWTLFFAYIPFVVNRAFSATPTEWLQQYSVWIEQIVTDETKTVSLLEADGSTACFLRTISALLIVYRSSTCT